MAKTDNNLEQAIAGEAKARLEHIAFAMQAMHEGYPQIAQLFMEAAGAETVHGINHLRAANRVGSTFENLDKAANGENDELEKLYPSFLHEAVQEGRDEAAASFHLAVEREKRHRAMFKEAFEEFKTGLMEKM
jgi:rubrerythrin